MTTQPQRSDDFERRVIAPLSLVFVFLAGVGAITVITIGYRIAPAFCWIIGRIAG
jgi:hypothetical protein